MAGTCPLCGAEDVEIIDWEISAVDDGEVTVEFSCGACKANASATAQFWEADA